MQDGIRFTPNNGAIGEDVIGEVILNKDLNSFVASRYQQYQQQMQQAYQPGGNQQSNLHVGSMDNIGVTGNNNISNSNYTSELPSNSANTEVIEVTKVVKLRFEIDFQINLNVVSK